MSAKRVTTKPAQEQEHTSTTEPGAGPMAFWTAFAIACIVSDRFRVRSGDAFARTVDKVSTAIDESEEESQVARNALQGNTATSR